MFTSINRNEALAWNENNNGKEIGGQKEKEVEIKNVKGVFYSFLLAIYGLLFNV